MGFVVAVDGPAGSGKGTVTKMVAEKLNMDIIDTGAMYRCVALKMLEQNVKIEDTEKLKNILADIKIKFEQQGGEKKVLLNGKDVTHEIRNKEVSAFVSPVATIKEVREKLTSLQREIAQEINVIMEGRDIGSKVFPNANVKIYLDATPEERAKRRYKQNQENNINIPFDEVLKNIKERDYIDSHREIAPLVRVPDAIYIDSTNMEIEKVAETITQIIKEKMN